MTIAIKAKLPDIKSLILFLQIEKHQSGDKLLQIFMVVQTQGYILSQRTRELRKKNGGKQIYFPKPGNKPYREKGSKYLSPSYCLRDIT